MIPFFFGTFFCPIAVFAKGFNFLSTCSRTTAPGRREVKTPMELSVAAVAAATSAEVLALVGDEGLT